MKKVALFFFIIVISLFMPPTTAQPTLLISISPKEVEIFPGDSFTINVTLKNVGNETAYNVTVYAIDQIKGVLFTQGYVNALSPGESRNLTLKVYTTNPSAGLYKIHIVAKWGNQLVEDILTLKVRSVVNFSLLIDGSEKVRYGRNATFTLAITSYSNLLLYGDAKVEVKRDGKTIQVLSYKPIVKEGESWVTTLSLPGTEVGNYTILFSANFYGREKKIEHNFTIYRRNLSYTVKFENGKIIVNVFEGENPASDVKVTIDALSFVTGKDGKIEYEVNEPGVYTVTLDLDGKVVEELVRVKTPLLFASQENTTLIVRAVDPDGYPIEGIVIKVFGPKGYIYNVTDSNGIARFNLNDIGYGEVEVSAESSKYLPASTTFITKKPVTPTSNPPSTEATPTKTPTFTPSTTVQTPSPTPVGTKISSRIWEFLFYLALFLGTVLFTSYFAFFRPIIVEDNIGKGTLLE